MKIYFAWAIALSATFISLIFSEILKYPPCSLCWYQRVFMYSLVFVIATGILLKDKKVSYYAAVLSGVGVIIAFYHSLIYHGFIKEALTLCTADLSCSTKQFELFGVFSIPVMSLLAFIIIFILSAKGVRDEKRN